MFNKDTIITSGRKKTETLIFSCCFLLAFALNVIAVITYKTPVLELITEIFIVLLIASGLYFLTVIVRFSIRIIKILIQNINIK